METKNIITELCSFPQSKSTQCIELILYGWLEKSVAEHSAAQVASTTHSLCQVLESLEIC